MAIHLLRGTSVSAKRFAGNHRNLKWRSRSRQGPVAGCRGEGILLSMNGPSHATLASFRMDLNREAEQRKVLEQMIIPGVREFPGFVSGHWTVDRGAGESLVLLTYDSLAAAEAMANNIRGNAENQRTVGLDLMEVRILDVLASASRTP